MAINTIKEHGQAGWDILWKAGNTQWDHGKSSPVLVNLVKENILPNGIALVPGCGTGYDLITLASDKRHVVGLDISETAVAKAKEYLKDAPNVEIRAADFFTLDMDGQIDLMYDYTFLCALTPELRPNWSSKVAKLVKPGGVLVTLMFPLGNHEGGPPFALSVDLYKELLQDNFDLTRLDEDIESHADRKGKEKLGIWTRKQNHL